MVNDSLILIMMAADGSVVKGHLLILGGSNER